MDKLQRHHFCSCYWRNGNGLFSTCYSKINLENQCFGAHSVTGEHLVQTFLSCSLVNVFKCRFYFYFFICFSGCIWVHSSSDSAFTYCFPTSNQALLICSCLKNLDYKLKPNCFHCQKESYCLYGVNLYY